jgi:hypothetical protein
MKSISYRTWVLILGIAVAVVIGIAALVSGSPSSTSFSMTPRKTVPSSAPSVIIKKVLDKIDLGLFRAQ